MFLSFSLELSDIGTQWYIFTPSSCQGLTCSPSALLAWRKRLVFVFSLYVAREANREVGKPYCNWMENYSNILRLVIFSLSHWFPRALGCLAESCRPHLPFTYFSGIFKRSVWLGHQGVCWSQPARPPVCWPQIFSFLPENVAAKSRTQVLKQCRDIS
jgi:hypothetical protein